MTDKERVVKGLEYCEKYFNCCDKCPYWDGGTHCTADLAHDALAMLKEQKEHETVKPIRLENWWKCPYCSGNIVANMNYCPRCGKELKWE